jgi:hypothetical protein
MPAFIYQYNPMSDQFEEIQIFNLISPKKLKFIAVGRFVVPDATIW